MPKSEKKKNQYIFIYATFPSKKTVLSITEKLIEKKLIVCANISEHDSIYAWNKRIYEEKEYGVFFKTREDKWKKTKKYILEKHPYETPVILKFKIRGFNKGFKKWIDESLKEQD
ncbi:Divalent-cation tolerance protein CutA [Methanimicrococcus sp. At1]|uniref:Divalent-cation tolerance protein CutA n=1 Tax=Methanimicrococcus hacksteinii TaxID=3028293 RepID=A0ABU3VMR4_9EURY|nr:divalent-cation tolerance protein CutA [Methanimicrococcus sp. At1]MDV0444694.1 Divalent-cation tolerance protein CutA [Methanimicrococcus sp. At1]